MQNIEHRLIVLEQQLAALITAHNGALELLATSQAFVVTPLAPQAQVAEQQHPFQAPQQQYQSEPQQVSYAQQPQAQLQSQAPQYRPQQPQQQQASYAPVPQAQQQAVVPQQQPTAVTHEALQGLFMAKFNEGKGQGLQATLAPYGVRTVAELPQQVLADVFNQVVGL